MARLTNEQLQEMVSLEQFQQWLFNRLSMRMTRANIPPKVKLYSLGEWIAGIEESGILSDIAEDDMDRQVSDMIGILASLEGGE